MYHATMKGIADGDFFKFNAVASEASATHLIIIVVVLLVSLLL